MWCSLAPNKELHHNHDTQVEARDALARPHASKTMPRKSRQTRRHLANLLARTHLGCFDAHPHWMHVEEARKREREVRVLGREADGTVGGCLKNAPFRCFLAGDAVSRRVAVEFEGSPAIRECTQLKLSGTLLPAGEGVLTWLCQIRAIVDDISIRVAAVIWKSDGRGSERWAAGRGSSRAPANTNKRSAGQPPVCGRARAAAVSGGERRGSPRARSVRRLPEEPVRAH